MNATPDGDGDCFEVAFRLITGEFAGNSSARLVHGMPLGTGGAASGLRYWHAWLECDGVMTSSDGASVALRVVIDRANGNDAVLPVALYRYVGQVEITHEYMLGEAIFEALKSGHYGPWVDD